MSQDFKDEVDGVIVAARLLDYSVTEQVIPYNFVFAGKIIIFSKNKITYDLRLETMSGKLYHTVLKMKGNNLYCSNRDDENQDLMFPVNVLKLLIN